MPTCLHPRVATRGLMAESHSDTLLRWADAALHDAPPRLLAAIPGRRPTAGHLPSADMVVLTQWGNGERVLP